MTDGPFDVSVVICAYTEARWNDLVAAIASVRQQTLSAREIVLVIDHNPRLLEKAHNHLSDVVLVENHGPAGANGSRNAGVTAAKGTMIAFLDDDALATPDWLKQLVAGFENPQVLGVGGLIEPLWLQGRPTWFPEEFYWVLGCSYRGMPQKAEEVRNLIGCNMAIRREVWEAIGGFWHRFGHVGGQPRGCGDTEFGIRIHQRWPQHVLLYTPQAKVYHRVPTSRACWHYFLSRCKFEGHSKALLAQAVGTRDGLSSERSYAFRTLPRGVIRGIADSLLGRDMTGLARAGAIVAGLAIATAGYIAESMRPHSKDAALDMVLSEMTQSSQEERLIL